MSRSKTVAVVGSSVKRPGSYDFSAANVSSRSVGADIDPIISIDHFNIRKPVFAPHPHAGFSAVTYLFEDSEGKFVNRDSLGHEHIVEPGSVIWNITGRGVMHQEFPKVNGQLSHGLQMFVNLSSQDKLRNPEILLVNGPDIPIFQERGVRIRVIVGSVGTLNGKINPPGNITFLDATLKDNASFSQPVRNHDHTLVYVIQGSLFLGEEKKKKLNAGNAASLNFDGESVFFETKGEGAQFVMISAPPLREPIVSHGPFVMNNEQQIQEAFARYRAGAMGTLKSNNQY